MASIDIRHLYHADATPVLWKNLCRVRKHLLAADPDNLDGLHHLRICYKKLRYLLELRLQATPPDKAKQKALRDWQEELGNIGDLRVMSHYARKLGLLKSLQQKYRRQARQQSRRFMKRRKVFAALITELDQQLAH